MASSTSSWRKDGGELIGGTRGGQDHRDLVGVKLAQEVPGGRESMDVVEELPVPVSPGHAGFRAVPTQQLWDELVAAHSDQPVDGVHGGPLAHIAKGSRPGQGVKIVGVDERPVYVEEDSGPKVSSRRWVVLAVLGCLVHPGRVTTRSLLRWTGLAVSTHGPHW